MAILPDKFFIIGINIQFQTILNIVFTTLPVNQPVRHIGLILSAFSSADNREFL